MSASDPMHCVVFDIDDTLYLERSYVRSGFMAIGEFLRREHGVSGAGDRAWELFLSGHRATTFDSIVAEFELSPDIVTELVRRYRTHSPAIVPLDDATAAVARLQAIVALAVITDGPVESQRAKATALGVYDWSQATVLTAELGEGRSKPAPEPYLEVQRRIPGAVSYAYIADNPTKDFVSPRQLGWRTVRVRRSNSLHQSTVSGDDVDIEVTDLDGIEAALWPAAEGPVPFTNVRTPTNEEGQDR